jgi:hypothetical protein
MQLHLAPDAPAAAQVAAAAILYAHIGGAFIGLVTGFAALAVRKGGPSHRRFGDAFCVAMLAMSGVGALVAPFLPAGQAPNTMMGAFTFYLVATGWAAARRRPNRSGVFEIGAALFAIALAVSGIFYSWTNAHGPHPLPSPEGPVIATFAGLVTMAAIFDIRAILGGGVSGASRLTRHLWRMSVALLIAATSFAGQPKAIPAFLRDSPLTLLPALAALIALVYWLARVRWPKPRRDRQAVTA